MPSSAWHFAGGGGGIEVPAGLIVGLKSGATVPDGWDVWSAADGKFLKGTTDDGTVGTTGTRSTLTLTVGSAGGHNSGGEQPIRNYGDGVNSGAKPTSKDATTVGAHGSHSVDFTYRPASARLKMIQATGAAVLPPGTIMFGDAPNEAQSPYTTFDGDRILEAGTTTGTTAQTATAATTSSDSSGEHAHRKSEFTAAGPNQVNNYGSGGGTSGGAHTHAGGTPAFTPNISRATIRAFEIVNAAQVGGLIGMWADTGCPDGWEVVAGFDGKFLAFSSTGDGTASGDNTVSVSGTTGVGSHFHGTSSYGTTSYACIMIPHGSGLGHTHSYSGSLSYEPERYHIKFIRYVG